MYDMRDFESSTQASGGGRAQRPAFDPMKVSLVLLCLTARHRETEAPSFTQVQKRLAMNPAFAGVQW